jgi:hypothetical protein
MLHVRELALYLKKTTRALPAIVCACSMLLLSCSKTEPFTEDLDGKVYYSRDKRDRYLADYPLPKEALSFSSKDSTAVFTVSEGGGKYLQFLGKYIVEGDKVKFEGWSLIYSIDFPNSAALTEYSSAFASYDYRTHAPQELSFEANGGKIVVLRRQEDIDRDDLDAPFVVWDEQKIQQVAAKVKDPSRDENCDKTFPARCLRPKVIKVASYSDKSAEMAAANALPNPSGSYSDREGGLSLTFLSTGKFYEELLGETRFGTWSRSGGEVEITYDDGSSTSVKLGLGFVEINGMRLTK